MTAPVKTSPGKAFLITGVGIASQPNLFYVFGMDYIFVLVEWKLEPPLFPIVTLPIRAINKTFTV